MRITQDTPGVPGTSTPYTGFGTAVAIADLDKDGLGEIIVGAPGQKVSGRERAGAVTVVPGRKTGTPGAGSYQISQETALVVGASEEGDGFGLTLTVGDVRSDGHPDLIVGAEGEDRYRGGMWVLPGSATGPTGRGSVLLTAATLGIPGDLPQVGGFQPR
ncbi:FG-GAP repeat protein [Streptomyces sp. NPDC057638]|uniref:FG-GAP repeat protein n=1 Tax=Streptomyces sp. NPDC057638 TaxID=3346190 RepID=UPI0036856751